MPKIKEELSQINNLTLHLRELRKKKRLNPTLSDTVIMKIRPEIKQRTEKSIKIKAGLFQHINKTDKPLTVVLVKPKTQTNEMINESALQ